MNTDITNDERYKSAIMLHNSGRFEEATTEFRILMKNLKIPEERIKKYEDMERGQFDDVWQWWSTSYFKLMKRVKRKLDPNEMKLDNGRAPMATCGPSKERLDLIESKTVKFTLNEDELSNYEGLVKVYGWDIVKNGENTRLYKQFNNSENTHIHLNTIFLKDNFSEQLILNKLSLFGEVRIMFIEGNIITAELYGKRFGKSKAQGGGEFGDSTITEPLKETWLTKFKNWIW